jgi:hypothetical protein
MASGVVNWLDQGLNMPTVQGASGSFAGLDNSTAIFANPWVFGAGVPALWVVGGFTFNLIASTIVAQGTDFLLVSGTGIITGNGFDPTRGSWFFSIQEGPAGDVFSWSGGSAATPDGGTTVALLGLALAGIECTRRKLSRSKT